MQCNAMGSVMGARQCIAVYIRVDRAGAVRRCADEHAGCCTACARFQLKSRPLSATSPATSPKRLHSKASTLVLSRCADRRTLHRNTIYHVTPHVPTRVCGKPLGSSALWKLHLLLQTDFRVHRAQPMSPEHGVARSNSSLLLARSSA